MHANTPDDLLLDAALAVVDHEYSRLVDALQAITAKRLCFDLNAFK